MCVCVRVRVRTQSCPTHCDPMDCSPPGYSVHGIFQARVQEQVVISYSKGSFQPRDRTRVFCVSCIGRRVLTTVPPGSPDSKQSGLLSQQMVTTLTRLSSIRVLCGAPGPSSQESRILLAPSVSQSQMSLKLYSYLRLTNLCWIFQLPFLQSWRSLKEKPCRTIRVTSWTRTIPCHWDDDSAWCGVVPPVSPHPSFTIRIFCFQLVRRILDLFSSLLGANCMSHSFPPIGGSILYLLPGLLQSCQSCHICYSLHSRKTATTIFLKCKSDTIKSPTYKWVPFQECICKFNLFLSPTKLV